MQDSDVRHVVAIRPGGRYPERVAAVRPEHSRRKPTTPRRLRKARNRVAHHEAVRVAEVNSLTRRINRYAGYVSSELARYIRHTSTVNALLGSRP
jgi:hypothetical protein